MSDIANNGSFRADAADDPIIAALIALAATRLRLVHAEKDHGKSDAAVCPQCDQPIDGEAAVRAAQVAEHRAVEAVFARRPRTTAGAFMLLAFAVDTFEDYGVREFDSAGAIRAAFSIIGGAASSVSPGQKTLLH